MTSTPGQRLDHYLVSAGLAPTRSQAAGLIQQGVITVNGQVVHKPGKKVASGDTVESQADQQQWASRAGHKLAGALDIFRGIDVKGATCLDAGASTGGFTDVLLHHGAGHVHAVDVGHDQLVPRLRVDPRVSVYEGLNIRVLSLETLGEPVEVVVSDLSFISLTLVLEPLGGVCADGADVMLMVKPQFEVGKKALPKSGVVTDPQARLQAVTRVVHTAARHGLDPVGLSASTLPGQDGNREFFCHAVKRPSAVSADALADWVRRQNVDWGE